MPKDDAVEIFSKRAASRASQSPSVAAFTDTPQKESMNNPFKADDTPDPDNELRPSFLRKKTMTPKV